MSWRHAAGPTSSNPRLHLQKQKGSRLKEVKLDPLDAVGLPSKGDERLLDFHTQEEYFRKTLVRYEALLNANRQGDDNDDDGINDDDNAPLNLALESLSIGSPAPASSAHPALITNKKTKHPLPRLTTVKPSDKHELSTLTTAMRKIREAIVATARNDAFAVAAYTFIIRANILTGNWEGYHPALIYLLRVLLPALNATSTSTSTSTSKSTLDTDLSRFHSYYILDLACRLGDLSGAYHYHYHYHHHIHLKSNSNSNSNSKSKTRTGHAHNTPTPTSNNNNNDILPLLHALTHGNYHSYWSYRGEKTLDRYSRRLCEWGDERTRKHALDCLGAGYLSVRMGFVEVATGGRRWDREGLGVVKPAWEVEEGKEGEGEEEGGLVVIRRVRGRKGKG